MMLTKAVNRIHIQDALALLVTTAVIVIDQVTKSSVVTYLSPPKSRSVSLLGQYLVLYYVQNNGAAFSLLTHTAALVVLIVVALVAIGCIYLRTVYAGPWYYKVFFGLIIGGAVGNVIDRIHNRGYVVDFIAFRIPQVHFHFAIFNIADACISTGVILFLMFLLFTQMSKKEYQPENIRKEAIHHE